MTRLARLTLVVLATLTVAGRAPAESLGDTVRAAGFEKLLGHWVDQESGGERLQLTYAWRIEDHALGISMEMGERMAEALVGIDPSSGDVVHFARDNQGGATTGRWDGSDDTAILHATHVTVDGERNSFTVTHRFDGDALRLTMKGEGSSEGVEIVLVKKQD